MELLIHLHGAAIKVCEWISNSIPFFIIDVITYSLSHGKLGNEYVISYHTCDYLSMLVLKLIHASKRDPDI